MVPVVYHPGYNITACGLERLHPFDGCKYRRIHDELVRQGVRKPGDFVRPGRLTRTQLERLHTPDYLRSLRRSSNLARILEVGVVAALPAVFVDWRVLRPMRLACGGTLLACRRALECGLAINLGGGFHHASGSHGHGFCVYADVPTALALLHDEGRIRSALIIDTDAHQGDGNALAAREWVRVLDLYEEMLFPWPKAEEEMPVPLPSGLDGEAYLRALNEGLDRALRDFTPDLAVYNAGSDVLATDPLATLRLTPEHLAERDMTVIGRLRKRGIPVAMVLSGGYGLLSWRTHVASIEGILTRFDREG